MKTRNTLTILTLFYCVLGFAQVIPNNDFENWYSKNLYENPDGYFTTNAMTYPETDSTFVNKFTDSETKGSAVALEPFGTPGNVSASMMILGNFTMGGVGGYPFTSRPDSLVIRYKTTYSNADTGRILLLFKKAGNYIAFTELRIPANGGSYTRFSVPVSFFIPLIKPDTVAFLVFSGEELGKKLIIDEVKLTNSTSTFPNMDFNSWSMVKQEEPSKWITSNPISGVFYGNTVIQSVDAFSGNSAIQINNFNTGFMGSMPGMIATGRYDSFSGSTVGGIALDTIPGKLRGYYKYVPEGNDLALVDVFFSKYDQVDQVSYIVDSFSMELTASSTFKIFELYFPTIQGNPDTVNILIRSGNSKAGTVQPGSVLTIDKLSFEEKTATRLPEIKDENTISFYPNPASDQVTFTFSSDMEGPVNIQILDLNGKVVAETIRPANDESSFSRIDISHLKKGTYLYRVTGKLRALVGKLTVIK